jgi:hypothetical protein
VANITLITNSLASGELDPKVLGRVDLPAVQAGCSRMRGFIPMKNGGARRTPGTYFAGNTRTPVATNLKARMVTFQSAFGSYAAEFTDTSVRFWASDHAIAGTTLTTTILEAELFQMQVKVVNGEMWIVHASHPVQRITETSLETFTMGTAPTFTGSRTFASANNYPSVVATHRGSLVFGATNAEPSAYFLSRSPDAAAGVYRLTDFTLGANPDDAIIGYNSDGKNSRILWIEAHRRMLAGMTNSIWADGTGFPSAANFFMQLTNDAGAAFTQAVRLGNAIFYIGAPIPVLQMLLYSEESGGVVEVPISRFYESLLKPSIIEMTAMASPEPMIWLTRSDGSLVSCTVDTTTGSLSIGFAIHERSDGGLVESACAVRMNGVDELWMSVLRGTARCVEWMTLPTDDDLDFTELHYVDSGIRWTGAATNTVSGLTHLNGKTVHAIADGGSMPAVVVSGGVATYTKTFTKIHVGLPMDARFTPTRPEVQANATWQGKKKSIDKCTLRIHNSYGGKIAAGKDPADTDFQVIAMENRPEQPLGTPPAPVTDDIDITLGGYIDTDGQFTIRQDEPFPLTVLAVMTRIKLQEA